MANYHPIAWQQAQQRARWLLWALSVFYVLMSLFLMLSGKATDEAIVVWAQQHTHGFLKTITAITAEIGEPHLAAPKALLPAIFLIFYGYRREGLFLMATLLADVGNLILKELINRARPTPDIADVLEYARNPGFPSGHTVNFIVYFGFLLVILPVFGKLNKTARWLSSALLLFFIFPAPFTRIYAGMHWPSDIMGGGMFGIIFLAMLCYAYFRPGKKTAE